MNFAIRDALPHHLADLVDDVGPAIVENGVDGVKAQSIELVLLEPIKCVVDEEIAHRPAFGSGEIDSGAPRGMVALGEEIGRNRRQVIPLRAEVIVNDVEQDGEAAGGQQSSTNLFSASGQP